MKTIAIKSETYEIKKQEEKIKREDLIYIGKSYTYDFQQNETIKYLAQRIYNYKFSILETGKGHKILLKIQQNL